MRDSQRRNLVICASCERERPNEGRGLCCACYYRHRQNGDLDRFPRVLWRSADLVEDWEFLARQGYTRQLAAERIGVAKKRLEKAIEREAKRRQPVNIMTETGLPYGTISEPQPRHLAVRSRGSTDPHLGE